MASRKGIVLGRERTFYDTVRKKDGIYSYSVNKLRKSNVGRQLPRKIRLRTEGDSITTICFIHPEKPQKSFETPITDLIEVNLYPKERRVRLTCRIQTDFTRFTFHSENEYEEFKKFLEQSGVVCHTFAKESKLHDSKQDSKSDLYNSIVCTINNLQKTKYSYKNIRIYQ